MAELNELLRAGAMQGRPRATSSATAHQRRRALRPRAPALRPLPAEAFDYAGVRQLPGGPQGPGLACAGRATRCRPAYAGRRLDVRSAPRRSRPSTGPGWWPVTRGAKRAEENLILDHYLEVFRSSPGRCPGPRHLPRPGPRGRSPRSTNASGPRLAALGDQEGHPGADRGAACCTAAWPPTP